MAALLLHAYQDWDCPNCGVSERTPAMLSNASRFHSCSRLHGLTAPLVRAGTDCKVVALERADYLGREIQAMGDDDGKAYMAVETVHADGHTDRAVNAGLATLQAES
jgi:hypothetical protein